MKIEKKTAPTMKPFFRQTTVSNVLAGDNELTDKDGLPATPIGHIVWQASQALPEGMKEMYSLLNVPSNKI